MEADDIGGEVFDEHELEEAVRNVDNVDAETADDPEGGPTPSNCNNASPSKETIGPTLSPVEEEEEDELLDIDTEAPDEHEDIHDDDDELSVEKKPIIVATYALTRSEADDLTRTAESNPATAEATSSPLQIRSLEELCEPEGEHLDDNHYYHPQQQELTPGPSNPGRKPCRVSERKRRPKKLNLESDSDELVNISSDDEWNPGENGADPDFMERQRKRRRVTFRRAKRKRRPLKSGLRHNQIKRFKPILPRSTESVTLKPRPTPPPLQSVDGMTPLLVIKPLQIPNSLLQKTKSFVIKQEGHTRIQVVPKFKSGSHARTPPSSRICGNMDSKLVSSPLKTPVASSQQCANCNVRFCKLTPRISHFRLNDERLSAAEAYQKIFQLQLQKNKKIGNIDLDKNAGLCSECGKLIAKIYGAVYDFTQKRSANSYFHQATAVALRSPSKTSNGPLNDIKPYVAKRNVMTSTDSPETCDKSTNYPVDPPPYKSEIPVVPTKVDDYSRVTALCDICGKGLTKESGLKTHLLLTHSISQEEKARDFVCGICGKAYFFQYLLKNHMSVHSDIKPFSCPKENCTSTFKSRASLRTHRIEVHELREQGQTFECEHCKKKYLRPRDLRDHVLARHSDTPQFECPHCHKMFQRKKNVRTHKCPSRPPPSEKKNMTVLQDAGNSANQSQSLISGQTGHTHADLLLVKNSANANAKMPSSELEIPSEIAHVLETIHEEYHQPPEAVEHIEIDPNSLEQRSVHYISDVDGHEVVHTTAGTQHIITPGTETVQYIQPISFQHYSQEENQHIQVHQQPQIHQYRIHSIGPQSGLEGETISVYETVNFLDLLNDTRQHPPNTTGTYHTLSFTK